MRENWRTTARDISLSSIFTVQHHITESTEVQLKIRLIQY